MNITIAELAGAISDILMISVAFSLATVGMMLTVAFLTQLGKKHLTKLWMMAQQIMTVMGSLAVLSLIGVIATGVFKMIIESFSNKNLWLSFNLYLEGWAVKVHPLFLETWFRLKSYLYLQYKI